MKSITHPKILARFMEKVEVHPSGCWLWRAGCSGPGYGVIDIYEDGKHTKLYAHRYSYMLAKGEIPEGMHLDHLCRIVSCVNPTHLEVVTPRENMRRGPGIHGMKNRLPWHMVRTDTEKRCYKCRTFKPFSEFYGNNQARDNTSSLCKDCTRIHVRESMARKKAREELASE